MYGRDWKTGGMRMAWKTRSSRRKTSSSDTLSGRNPPWIGLRLNPCLHVWREVTNSLRHGTILQHQRLAKCCHPILGSNH